MKNARAFILFLLLAIAAPFAAHYRAWSLTASQGRPVTVCGPVQTSGGNFTSIESQRKLASSAIAQGRANSQSNESLDLPAGSSSLPLLSVIGFGIFLGGLISALRTRPAHK
ncbi:MAG: hypothetical protein DMG62_04860 [Acidobacteria bacterium]|nr:MAG: hypothetical protein DMG63_14960 [Acidobacteriota bacterium]PYY24052.1 MAG: hypothetical protein DMG62_04860 [Acidobacteriota bacterium]